MADLNRATSKYVNSIVRSFNKPEFNLVLVSKLYCTHEHTLCIIMFICEYCLKLQGMINQNKLWVQFDVCVFLSFSWYFLSMVYTSSCVFSFLLDYTGQLYFGTFHLLHIMFTGILKKWSTSWQIVDA